MNRNIRYWIMIITTYTYQRTEAVNGIKNNLASVDRVLPLTSHIQFNHICYVYIKRFVSRRSLITVHCISCDMLSYKLCNIHQLFADWDTLWRSTICIVNLIWNIIVEPFILINDYYNVLIYGSQKHRFSEYIGI